MFLTVHGKHETPTHRGIPTHQYFLANDKAPDNCKQVPPQLSLMGGKTYTLLRDFTSPDKPTTKTFVELC